MSTTTGKVNSSEPATQAEGDFEDGRRHPAENQNVNMVTSAQRLLFS